MAYKIAGLNRKEASESISISNLNVRTCGHLPESLKTRVAIELTRKATPQTAIDEILANPTVTVKEAKEMTLFIIDVIYVLNHQVKLWLHKPNRR